MQSHARFTLLSGLGLKRPGVLAVGLVIATGWWSRNRLLDIGSDTSNAYFLGIGLVQKSWKQTGAETCRKRN